jgi:formate C-acetyltransferase/4-hydroxyphenylacetate decarboxylase large subunit
MARAELLLRGAPERPLIGVAIKHGFQAGRRIRMPQVAEFTPREVVGRRSTTRVARRYAEYLSEPLYIDCEYIRLYTQRHREVTHWEEQERRAECHAYALERLTPVIREGELIVGGKTRYVRGAIPYANYAAEYILRELRREQHDAQDAVTDLGTGGGIARVQQVAEAGEHEVFCSKFLISAPDKAALHESAEYWLDKCMQAEGNRLWKRHYPHADWIEKGWQTVLYSAPHDPAPEGRLILDFETILGQGLNAIIRRCEEKITETMAHPSCISETAKVHFWRAAIRTLQATITWAHNYGHIAGRLASAEADSLRRQELNQIAAHCLSFGKPPGTFREALQHFWFAYLAGHIEGAHLGYSVGRFDRYMYPFYQQARERGELSEESMLELLELLRIKHTEIEYAASFSWEGLGSGNLFQNLILGGYTADGLPADNELSRLVLRAAIDTPTTQPTLSIWWTPGLSEEFLVTAAECVKTGVGFPAWFNTDIYLKHELMRNPGMDIGFIRKYAAMGGCTEPVLEGCSYGVVQPGFINHLKVLELALYGGTDPRTGTKLEERPPPTDYPGLVEEYRYFLARAIRHWQEYWNIVMEAHSHTTPLIFCSAVMRDCVERGRNMDHGGLLNNATPTTLSSGLVNVVNSLAAVRVLLEQGACDLDQLRTSLRADWQGCAPLRRRCIESPKWGNDDPRVDELFRELWHSYCEMVEQGPSYLGDHYDPSMLAISTPAPFGKACLATPDGRHAGEPLADGVTSPHPGTDTNGPTAVLRSVQKVDHTRIRGGLHNMKFHPDALRGRRGSLQLIQLIKTLFETQTAFQIQFNVVDSRMLRDAQTHPEKYRDLIVRVAGFSAFFVELGKAVQDQVIERTEHGL